MGVVAGALLILPLAIKAQQPGKVPRIGYLGQNNAEISQPQLAAFREGLRERGWVEGQNVVSRFDSQKAKLTSSPPSSLR
jgi:hypothetical protein